MAAPLLAMAAFALFLVVVGAGALFCRRYFARKSNGAPVGAAGAERDAGGGRAGQTKALNDVIEWAFSHPRRRVDEWVELWMKELTKQAAKHESQEGFQVRFVKVENFEAAPQLSSFSTQHLSSEKTLVIRTDFHWKHFDLVLSLTPLRTGQEAHCSIECRLVVFEFHAVVDVALTVSKDVSVLSAKCQAEPTMRMELRPNQDVNLDIEKLQRLVRRTIPQAEFRVPLLISISGGKTVPIDHFESSEKIRSISSANTFSENEILKQRKLLVKVVKASGLGASEEYDHGAHQPFCVVAIDSPVQRCVSSSVKNTSNPFFDEHFILDMDRTTKKLTFELRDKDRPETDDFLGMTSLTVDEFVRNRHVLPLTGRGPMTFGALTVEVTIIESAQLAALLAIKPNIECIAPREMPGVATRSVSESPTVLVSEPMPSPSTSDVTQLPPRYDRIPGSSTTLPPPGSLPPKGETKKKTSLVGAIKKRFKRNRADSRSRSADRAQERQQPTAEGIYLTPPPSLSSTNIESDEIPHDSENRSRSNSMRSGLRRLFHKRRQEADSPTSLSGRGFDHSPEGSTGQPSPRLRQASSNRQSPSTSVSGMTSSPREQRIR